MSRAGHKPNQVIDSGGRHEARASTAEMTAEFLEMLAEPPKKHTIEEQAALNADRLKHGYPAVTFDANGYEISEPPEGYESYAEFLDDLMADIADYQQRPPAPLPPTQMGTSHLHIEMGAGRLQNDSPAEHARIATNAAAVAFMKKQGADVNIQRAADKFNISYPRALRLAKRNGIKSSRNKGRQNGAKNAE